MAELPLQGVRTSPSLTTFPPPHSPQIVPYSHIHIDPRDTIHRHIDTTKSRPLAMDPSSLFDVASPLMDVTAYLVWVQQFSNVRTARPRVTTHEAEGYEKRDGTWSEEDFNNIHPSNIGPPYGLSTNFLSDFDSPSPLLGGRVQGSGPDDVDILQWYSGFTDASVTGMVDADVDRTYRTGELLITNGWWM
ncbi:hypothetical protein BV25DRAFT_1922759 [Artomyces pyxidatus]|uniref:Uncharacterized protein n=1 Tax=Artomyces pyxidatus TaxID=48021 RepID=A0ACB8SEE2_9AGAM|nr:hypothetical protein BV25DRAFT_1922759 [Artomyces pyxidatus]